jgi:methionine-rich copper-binding protein CopC
MPSLRAASLPAVATILMILMAVPAAAEVEVEQSLPGAGVEFETAPPEVQIVLSEAIAEGQLDVYDPCGKQVDDGDVVVEDEVVEVGMSSSRRGTHVVEWSVVTRAGEPAVGTFTFDVVTGKRCPPSSQPTVSHGHDPTPEPGDVAAPGPDDPDDPDDIPVNWLLVSYGIAALIGAVGGQIYLKIVR